MPRDICGHSMFCGDCYSPDHVARIEAARDAWAALARAERRDHGVARFGTDAEKNTAFAQAQAARGALRALGIDPDKEASNA